MLGFSFPPHIVFNLRTHFHKHSFSQAQHHTQTCIEMLVGKWKPNTCTLFSKCNSRVTVSSNPPHRTAPDLPDLHNSLLAGYNSLYCLLLWKCKFPFPPAKKKKEKIASAILSLILFKILCTLLISVKHLEADIHTSQQLNPTPQAVPILLQRKGDMLHCS